MIMVAIKRARSQNYALNESKWSISSRRIVCQSKRLSATQRSTIETRTHLQDPGAGGNRSPSLPQRPARHHQPRLAGRQHGRQLGLVRAPQDVGRE